MVETLTSKLRAWLFKSEYAAIIRQQQALDARERKIQEEVNQRVAGTLSKMDPFEPLMREFKGVFGELFEHPEERLDARGMLNLRSFGYTIADDPSFNFLCEWIMNSQGNETLLKAAVTPERILYGRAQISAMLAFRKEVRRLSESYKDMLAKRSGQEFDETLSTE